MNTGKTYLSILLTVGVAVALSSCGGQDEIYKEWVKKGGYDYPAKAVNLSSVIGYKSVIINWEKPMDPAVTTATLFWDNYASSQSIDYADYSDGKVSMEVGNLEDRSYTFDIVNYDAVGNKSLAAEITVSPYGDSWMVSRSERTVTSARMDGRDAKIVMSKSTDEMVATRFRYKNLQDEWVECETILKPGENEVTFPNALRGKRFEYSSSFCPAAGKDTVWSHWTKSVDGISYALDGKRWNVAVTKNQYFGINVADNIFDGNKDLSAGIAPNRTLQRIYSQKYFQLTRRKRSARSIHSLDSSFMSILTNRHFVTSRISSSMSAQHTMTLMTMIISITMVSRS